MEEHVLTYVSEHITELSIDGNVPFLRDGHYPLIAGSSYASNGNPLYVAKAWMKSLGSHYQYLAIPDGVRLERLSVKLHYSDEPAQIIAVTSLDVPLLSYDPSAYAAADCYSSHWKSPSGMDATGPYSWRFSRKLPKNQDSEGAAVASKQSDNDSLFKSFFPSEWPVWSEAPMNYECMDGIWI